MVWFFGSLVQPIGGDTYRHWLDRTGYGNGVANTSAGTFWLDGSLSINPLEQVAFLRCLAVSGCGFSARSLEAFESIAGRSALNGSRVFAKTGSGPVQAGDFKGAFEGWYVGYVRNAQGRWTTAFALFLEADSFATINKIRKPLTGELLSRLGLWDADAAAFP